MKPGREPVDLAEILPGVKSDKRAEWSGEIAVDGCTVEFTRDNIHIREVRTVTGLSSPSNRQLEALTTFGIPNPLRGHTHPQVNGLPCTRSTAELAKGSTEVARVTSEFSYPQDAGFGYALLPNDIAPPDIEVSTALTAVQTNYHYNAQNQWVPIILEQTFIVVDPVEGTSSEQVVKISPVIETQVPMATLVYRRKENWRRTQGRQVGNTVGDTARWYVGSLNSTKIFGDELYTWMCTRIVGVRDMQRNNWVADVTYEFQYNPHTWLIPVSILDENGYPHVDSVEGEGKKKVRVQRAMDFYRLELYF